MKSKTLQKIAVFSTALAVLSLGAADVGAQNSGAPVDLQADRLVHDENGQTVTAIGDVVLIQDGRTVKADEIVYNLVADTVVATGHVEFTDVNGDQHNANRAEFNDALKDGFVEGLQSFLVDGSRFKASTGHHVEGDKTVMKDAFYTPCETCKDNPDETPLWQIRASEVEHDTVNKKIKYHNARFEIKGVPIAYMPYFAHADGTVTRKSGFLTPTAGFSSDLGAFVESSYYWSIAPDKDLTVGTRVMTGGAPLGLLEWRQRWNNASLKARGSFTYSDRYIRQSGRSVSRDDELRGHVSADAKWDINNKWRSGIKLDIASDEQYMRQYDFDSDDVLHNEMYVERFSGRNYASGRILAFQDLRIEENRQDQPNILPEIEASFIGEPNNIPIIGGRWSADMSILGLLRDGDEQDMNRIHSELGWQRRLVSDYGLVTVLDANMQGTFYDVHDRTGSAGNSLLDGSSTEERLFGYLNGQISYPVAKQIKNAQILIEPMASVTISPNLRRDNDIPNEDSQDVQIDTLNIFEAGRFPGVDGVEDRSHVTYGMRTGIYGDEGSYGNVFLGQSYRLEEVENPFSEGSGLNEQDSDVVGQISASYKGDYTLDYRFQLDNHDLSEQRHEVDASMELKGLTLTSQYLFANALDGTDISETREQINNGASYYINDKWRIFGSARHDLGVDSGLRQANLGLDYTGQCITWSVTGTRSLTSEESGDNGTQIFFRVGFKNLGEFQSSGVQVAGGSE